MLLPDARWVGSMTRRFHPSPQLTAQDASLQWTKEKHALRRVYEKRIDNLQNQVKDLTHEEHEVRKMIVGAASELYNSYKRDVRRNIGDHGHAHATGRGAGGSSSGGASMAARSKGGEPRRHAGAPLADDSDEHHRGGQQLPEDSGRTNTTQEVDYDRSFRLNNEAFEHEVQKVIYGVA